MRVRTVLTDVSINKDISTAFEPKPHHPCGESAQVVVTTPTAKQQFQKKGSKYIPTGDFQHLQHPFCQVCPSLKLRDRQPRAPDDTEARRQGNPMFARKQKLQGSRRQEAGWQGGRPARVGAMGPKTQNSIAIQQQIDEGYNITVH